MRTEQITRKRRQREAVEAQLEEERKRNRLRPEPPAGNNPPRPEFDERRDSDRR